MKPESKPWTPSSIVLIMAGVTLIGVGVYFILLRPPLLPEDIRYMDLPAAQLDIIRPLLATGVLAVTLAATAFRAHQNGAAIGALIGGSASIGWMAVVNFMIGSDFKWVLLGMALLWVCSLVLFWFERKTPTHRCS